MSRETQTLAKLLRRFAETIEKSTATELRDLNSGHAYLAIIPNGANNLLEKSQRNFKDTADFLDFGSILQDLDGMTNRDNAIKLVESKSFTRKELVLICRHLDLPARKDETIDRLVEKIVDWTVGARLNSQAIRTR